MNGSLRTMRKWPGASYNKHIRLSVVAIAKTLWAKLIAAILVGTVGALAILPFYSPVAYASSPQTFYAHAENEGYEASDNEMDQRTPEPVSATYTLVPSATGDFQIPGNNAAGGRYFTAGWPSASTIPSGTWTFHTWIQRPGGTTNYYVKVFKNLETTAQFTSSSVAIPTSWAETDSTGAAPAIPMSAADRLRFEYWASVTANDTQTKSPTGDGDFTLTWTPTPATPTTLYDKVDEYPTPSDADYITSPTTYPTRQLFTFPAFSVPAGSTITDLTIHYRVQDATSGSNKITGQLKVNNTAYTHATNNNPPAPPTWTEFDSAWTTNPASGVAWTVNEINGGGSYPLQQWGVYSSDSSPAVLVSWIYAIVHYRSPISIRIDDNATPDTSTRVDTTVAEIVPTLGYFLITIAILFAIFVAVRRKVLVVRREVVA